MLFFLFSDVHPDAFVEEVDSNFFFKKCSPRFIWGREDEPPRSDKHFFQMGAKNNKLLSCLGVIKKRGDIQNPTLFLLLMDEIPNNHRLDGFSTL